MLSDHSVSIELEYGITGRFRCQSDLSRVVKIHDAPASSPQIADDVRNAIEHPRDFPPLKQALVPGDRVALAVDRGTPHAATIVAEIWRVLERQSISADNLVIIQPAAPNRMAGQDPRAELPADIRERVKWVIHDPDDESRRRYLATTAAGERIYLAAEITEADFVLPIGQIAFDPLIGFRGTNSVLYPNLSTSDAIARSRGQGHRELSPEEDRPLRQIIDEIAWLLGIQFTVQVIAGGRAGAAHVIAGAVDSVLRRGKELLMQDWMVHLDSRPQVVVAAVDVDASGHGWEQVGAALEVAGNLVASDGKIILLTELNAELDEGLKLVKQCSHPRDAMRPLRESAPADMVPAMQLAHAVDWAQVYLLSRLDTDVVEDLFMTPLESELEVQRLLELSENALFVGGAQNAYGWVRSS